MGKTVDVLIVRKEPLSILNKKANVLRFNRRLFQPMVDDLPNNQKTPILFHSMLDDKGLVRAVLEIKENVRVSLDMMIDDFNYWTETITLPNPNLN
tara:strand:- start:151 stop:438 length:288 start_codon:yes stop_codon:yes gene_type:complete